MGHADYFKELVLTYYPQRLNELEGLQGRVMLMDNTPNLSHLFIQKLITEINMLWRAEKHYWQHVGNADNTKNLLNLNFPKDYIVKKQKTISDLITQLRSLLFRNNGTNHNRQDVLEMLSQYIEIEYKLSALLIEKEKRIHQIVSSEPNAV